MKKILFGVVLTLFVFISCQNAESNASPEKNTKASYSIGEPYSCKGVVITATVVTNINNSGIYAIHVLIKNNTSYSIDYSSIFDWGNILTNNGEQINSITYVKYNNYFSGNKILPGAAIRDVITFTKYTGSADSFTFFAEPPIDGVPDYQIKFSLSEIESETY